MGTVAPSGAREAAPRGSTPVSRSASAPPALTPKRWRSGRRECQARDPARVAPGGRGPCRHKPRGQLGAYSARGSDPGPDGGDHAARQRLARQQSSSWPRHTRLHRSPPPRSARPARTRRRRRGRRAGRICSLIEREGGSLTDWSGRSGLAAIGRGPGRCGRRVEDLVEARWRTAASSSTRRRGG